MGIRSFYASSMHPDNAFGNGQAQTSAACLCPVGIRDAIKRKEDFSELGHGHSRTVVAHLNYGSRNRSSFGSTGQPLKRQRTMCVSAAARSRGLMPAPGYRKTFAVSGKGQSLTLTKLRLSCA